MTCAHLFLFLSLLGLWQPCSQHWNADQELSKNSLLMHVLPAHTHSRGFFSPLVLFCSSHQPPLLSHIILLPWMSRCEKHLTVPQSEVSHRCQCAVTRGPVPRDKKSHVSLQVNLENLIVSEQHSKPQVVQSWFWARYFHWTPVIRVPWSCAGRSHGRCYVLEPVFSCTSSLVGHSTDTREFKESFPGLS